MGGMKAVSFVPEAAFSKFLPFGDSGGGASVKLRNSHSSASIPGISCASLRSKRANFRAPIWRPQRVRSPLCDTIMPHDSFPKESVFKVQAADNAAATPPMDAGAEQASDRRLSAPAALRNREFIAEVLQGVLPKQGTVLEIASGTGEHVSLFASKFPNLTWQPSDIDTMALASIADWVKHDGRENLLPPLTLDVEAENWPLSGADAIVNSNMVHIAPYSVCKGLMRGASRLLPKDGVLVMYGPFKRNGAHTAPSNEQFDASLKGRNPSWGIRDIGEVAATAGAVGMHLEQEVSMPANNMILVFRKQA